MRTVVAACLNFGWCGVPAPAREAALDRFGRMRRGYMGLTSDPEIQKPLVTTITNGLVNTGGVVPLQRKPPSRESGLTVGVIVHHA